MKIKWGGGKGEHAFRTALAVGGRHVKPVSDLGGHPLDLAARTHDWCSRAATNLRRHEVVSTYEHVVRYSCISAWQRPIAALSWAVLQNIGTEPSGLRSGSCGAVVHENRRHVVCHPPTG